MNDLELSYFKTNYNSLCNNDIKSEDLRILLAASRTEIKKENSNNVVVYTGSYKKVNNKLLITYEGDLKANYKRYMDIETGELYLVKLSDVPEFEEKHTVIKKENGCENIQMYDRNYDEVRAEFFKGVITEPQDKVILKLVNKRKDQ